MSILPKVIYRFSAIALKIPMTSFTELRETILKSVWKHIKPQVAKAILKRRTEQEACCRVPVAHSCNPCYSGDRDQEDHSSNLAQEKKKNFHCWDTGRGRLHSTGSIFIMLAW
jgi:hypothetical protein